MFGRSFKLFKMFGFQVSIDASWLLLAILVVLSLTAGYFPMQIRGLPPSTYWVMGVFGAIGLFMSIILHEMCHSIVGRRFGIPMKGITLFIFGGVAQMENDTGASPKAEFLMAIAGPIASFAISGACYALYLGASAMEWYLPGVIVIGYLAWINTVLAIFNLLPAFPLDGGRILRSALWAWKKNLRWATRVASSIGSGFGIMMIVYGILVLLAGNFVGGLWWCLIGMFLQGISHVSYRQVVILSTLKGETVSRFMRQEPIVVPPSLSIAAFVRDYLYQHYFKMFPVMDGDRLLGSVSTREVKNVPREKWDNHTVGEITVRCSGENTIGPNADATDALSMMHKTGNSRIMVVAGAQLLGIIALKDMLRFLHLKLDLEGDERGAAQLGDSPDDQD